MAKPGKHASSVQPTEAAALSASRLALLRESAAGQPSQPSKPRRVPLLSLDGGSDDDEEGGDEEGGGEEGGDEEGGGEEGGGEEGEEELEPEGTARLDGSGPAPRYKLQGREAAGKNKAAAKAARAARAARAAEEAADGQASGGAAAAAAAAAAAPKGSRRSGQFEKMTDQCGALVQHNNEALAFAKARPFALRSAHRSVSLLLAYKPLNQPISLLAS